MFNIVKKCFKVFGCFQHLITKGAAAVVHRDNNLCIYLLTDNFCLICTDCICAADWYKCNINISDFFNLFFCENMADITEMSNFYTIVTKDMHCIFAAESAALFVVAGFHLFHLYAMHHTQQLTDIVHTVMVTVLMTCKDYICRGINIAVSRYIVIFKRIDNTLDIIKPDFIAGVAKPFYFYHNLSPFLL